jgi:hypothetical protein
MATSLKTTTRNKATDAITTDAGATAHLMVWSGSAPAKSSNNFVAPTGTLLATFALANPIGSGSAVGVLTLSAISNVTGAASGTPGYYRISTASSDTDGTTVIAQGSSGVGSGDLNFASTISSGGTVGITSFVYTEGNA